MKITARHLFKISNRGYHVNYIMRTEISLQHLHMSTHTSIVSCLKITTTNFSRCRRLMLLETYTFLGICLKVRATNSPRCRELILLDTQTSWTAVLSNHYQLSQVQWTDAAGDLHLLDSSPKVTTTNSPRSSGLMLMDTYTSWITV